ncbi:MAG: sigma-70 family RNA polymerase sigma factor [Actinobacteria bacterium]|nr:sigma-70 family RNA polymerase sigma factor [Actinomycetota bacterium]
MLYERAQPDLDTPPFADACPHRGAMLAMAARLLSRDRAEDVVQEVLLRYGLEPGRFDATKGSLQGYLLMATRSRAIDEMRSEQSRLRRQTHAVRYGSLRTADWDAVQSDLLERLIAVMRMLPQREREVIALAYFRGLSYRQVAELLALPEGTVKSRMRTGLARMRVMLEALEAED